MRLALAFAAIAAPAIAETCPPAPDYTAEETAIFDQLQALPSPVGSRELNNALWEMWTDAPDEAAQALLDQGMSQRSSYDLLGARDTLDRLVEYCPEYAEGYNQRAFANFLNADYNAAIYDLDIALELSPRHLGALTGKVLTLMRLDRNDEAQVLLREALALNPWLSERALLVEPEGEDISAPPLAAPARASYTMRTACPRGGMVDIGDLKSLGRKAVPVRVRPRVPKALSKKDAGYFTC